MKQVPLQALFDAARPAQIHGLEAPGIHNVLPSYHEGWRTVLPWSSGRALVDGSQTQSGYSGGNVIHAVRRSRHLIP